MAKRIQTAEVLCSTLAHRLGLLQDTWKVPRHLGVPEGQNRLVCVPFSDDVGFELNYEREFDVTTEERATIGFEYIG